MFSSRLPFDQQHNRLHAALAEKRRAGVTLLDLSESNPTRAGLLAEVPKDLLQPLADPRGFDGRWSMDLSALRSVCEAGPKAILLVNPNNPTGSFLRREELEVLAEICQHRQIALISDEVFGDYRFHSAQRSQETVTSLI